MSIKLRRSRRHCTKDSPKDSPKDNHKDTPPQTRPTPVCFFVVHTGGISGECSITPLTSLEDLERTGWLTAPGVLVESDKLERKEREQQSTSKQ
ncbi:uncharacterized protein EHS24_006892 [Apiotrichum porosum]|uniref:Uncharacterized protein n=1 Tax=Apiotrichum porosum TaxID=105984 RepID=A0A427XWX7_9TREE|nr:uncharacterized protein EHS24_006892 [Apiotrichum porosum]RSH83225.1 hypothetical protein EHS24_006892 [Apiotrichum porosum]